ncbi:MAG: CpsD/CapB family tyrosine-protein kinase [Myxococcota bacterium]|nr:CpsD/CapB family tyrosine-protein kinase [Myxococcota bacterium]
MAKVYDAMRRAEEERKRKIGGDVGVETAAPSALPWDEAPSDAGDEPEHAPFYKRIFKSDGTQTVRDNANDIRKRQISILQPDSFVAEQFRMLRGRIDSVAAQRPIHSIAVTSANSNEGKSTSSINLAIVTAMSLERKVLLVDCDMRRPQVHTTLGVEPSVGLAEVLLERNTLDEAILTVDGLNLDLLPVCLMPSNPSELLGSVQMRSLLEEVASRYDRVILDTPATLGLPDSKIVSEVCDGLVMVVRANVTPREDVHAALDALDRRRVLGLVLNGVDQSGERYGYY